MADSKYKYTGPRKPSAPYEAHRLPTADEIAHIRKYGMTKEKRSRYFKISDFGVKLGLTSAFVWLICIVILLGFIAIIIIMNHP